MAEALTTLPSDPNGVVGIGTYSTDNKFYWLRSDAQRQLKVALFSSDGNPLLTTVNPGYVRGLGSNVNLVNTTKTWADSASVNTTNDVDIALPAAPNDSNKFTLWVRNPSTVTALNYKVKVKFTISAVAYYGEIATGSIAANTVKAVVIEGAMVGEAIRITFDNATVLGGADTFTAYIQAWQF